MPSGYVAGVLGAKYLVGAAMMISSVLNLCVPLAADAGVALFVALRAVQGVAQVPSCSLSVTGIQALKWPQIAHEGLFSPSGYGVNRSVLHLGEVGPPTGKESTHHLHCGR